MSKTVYFSIENEVEAGFIHGLGGERQTSA